MTAAEFAAMVNRMFGGRAAYTSQRTPMEDRRVTLTQEGIDRIGEVLRELEQFSNH